LPWRDTDIIGSAPELNPHLKWINEAHRRVVVIGTDVPELDRKRMGQVVEALEASDLVLGPAADGGYYNHL
jgi:glycosyltransferase A (GT-A) superfamily protein (DUF2064 family)